MDDFTFSISNDGDLSAYEAQLMRDLNRITRRAINQWSKESDNVFKQALSVALEQASKAAYEELLGGIGNSAKGGSSSRLNDAISNLVAAQVSNLLFKSTTRTTVSETDASRNAEAAFRLSRAQRNAGQTSTSLKGQRNL